MPLEIDILYTNDCTDWEITGELIQQVSQELNLDVELRYWLIENDRQALQAYFIGSPTVRVDGSDLFPVEGATAGLRLRSYLTDEGIMGHPTYQMLVSALSAYQG
jgi:hypothetical protein